VDDEECHLNKNTVTSILHPIRSCIPRVWKSSSPSTGGLCFHLIFYLFFHVMTPHTSTWYSWYYHTPNTHEYEISSKTNSQIVDARRSFLRGAFFRLASLSLYYRYLGKVIPLHSCFIFRDDDDDDHDDNNRTRTIFRDTSHRYATILPVSKINRKS
jgi:hypothetical protein